MENKGFLLKNWVLLLIILCSISFYEIRFIPQVALKALEFMGAGLIVSLLILNSIYDKSPRIRKNFKVEISLILISVFLSMFGAYLYHDQPFAVTLVVQRYMYFFLLYFLLHQLKPAPNDVLKMIIYLGMVHAFIYIVSYLLYPNTLVHSKAAEARGTVRIFFPGLLYVFLSLFLSVYLFFSTKRKMYLGIAFVGILITILLGTRQVLVTIIFLLLMYILFSKKVKSKIAVFAMVAISLVPLYFIFQDIFISLIEVSKVQSQKAGDDVRLRAMKFFIFDFFPNKISYLTGNGEASSNSIFGVKVNQIKEHFGFYQSDIGLVGDFSKFGLLFVIGQLMIMYRVIVRKLDEKLAFIKLMMWSTVITMVTGGSPAHDAAAYGLMLYLIDAHDYMKETSPQFEKARMGVNKGLEMRPLK
jgi:hypothetical protein